MGLVSSANFVNGTEAKSKDTDVTTRCGVSDGIIPDKFEEADLMIDRNEAKA